MMRRPTLKWLIKTTFLVLISGTIFLLITSWISASPFTNKPVFAGSAEHRRTKAERRAEMAQQMQEKILPHADKLVNALQLTEVPAVVHKFANEIEVVPYDHKFKQPSKQHSEQNSNLKVQENDDLQLAPPASGQKKDWHDYTAMKRDTERVGIGEQGKPAHLDGSQAPQERIMSLQNGFNAMLSDSISVNRSLPDIRHNGCQKKLYISKLPTVSVVIIFYNEYLSVLMRSVHSLVNRSPPELLKEIILVDDCSDYAQRPYLLKPLERYVSEHFKNVRIVRLKSRTGLIGARSAGARAATQDVIIFLDSHVEANYNWLPPLLEPIALDKRTAVCPFIDVIDHSTFEYRSQDEGARGAFDWEFYYKRLPLLPEDLKHPTEPFKSPVMAGGLFAISREFFWELGGYDEGLDIWGGEQYELSFKIWMCHGQMVDAPCSRIGHIYRGPRDNQPSPRKGDYLHKNYKRVAEVWMDEYANFLYEHGDGIYETIDAGDLTEQKAIREKLQCKSFKWFMEKVAFDLLKVYPAVEPPDFAYGAIQNLGDTDYCVDTLNQKRHNKIGLYLCADNLKRPQKNQHWALSWHRDLRLRRKKDCLDVQIYEVDAPVWLWDCHGQGGNQFWYYNYKNKQLQHGIERKRCLEMLPIKQQLVVNKCERDNRYMQWEFGNVNKTALAEFFNER